MKSILVAFLSFLFLVATVLVMLRCYRGRKYFRILIAGFVLSIPFYIFLYRLSPSNFYFFPTSLLEPNRRMDFWNGLILLFLSFHTFWDFCYTSAFTGFSSNLLVILSRTGKMSEAQILDLYAAKGGLDGILSWRLPNLVQGKYLKEDHGRYSLLAKGRTVALITRSLKRLLALGEGG